ncbi:polymorphic toxin type 15 domain-containing protein [Ruminococcus callidus]|uniref:polymorphic toxin type 15 domain-containing protein n=1 Tax=Ruminococcus callidus TaxID=40519 RepID=UPI0035215035
MATITLYKDKINGVGSLLDNIIKSSNNLNAQLGTLKSTLQGVDSSTCNLQDTVDSISSSSKSESDKVEDLKRLNNKLTAFIEMTARRLGDSKINSSIGSQWKADSRIGTLDAYVDKLASGLTPAERSTTHLNVELILK